MSVGNTGTQGNKKNNMPYQLAMLQLLGQISTNTMGAGADYELITYNYEAIAPGPGYSIGDFITRTQIVFVPTGNIVSTLWFNQTTGLSIVAPVIGNLIPVAGSTSVTVNNLPLVLGQALMANSLAVTIASDQSPIPVTLPVGVSRTPSIVLIPASTPLANTIAGVKQLSIRVRTGANATIGGAAVPNGTTVTFTAADNDTVGSISYSTGLGTTLLISYLT